MTRYQEWPDATLDLLCGGTPCQSFSLAGLRKGLDDPRGNLMLTFGSIAARYLPRWLVWENVPGVLSSNGGRDFGAFLGMLAELGYGFAYRTLDAQYFGVAQRRRRVFVVGHLGDWRRAAAVLFERQGLSGHPAPSRPARQAAAPVASGGAGSGCGQPFNIANNLTARMAKGLSTSLNEGQTPVLAFPARLSGTQHAGSLDVAPTLGAKNPIALADGMCVRLLTPRECERLQGLPDDYTRIPYRGKTAADGPRYRALGNCWAVPVVRWIGRRIEAVDAVAAEQAAA